MGFVFISYSRQDTETVDTIVSRLKRDGFEVWIDRANIKGGDLWTVAIVEAIDTADSFVLMLSPSATTSDNVRKEVQLAQDAKRRLFPLVILAVTLPAQFRYQLAGIQMIDFFGNPETKYRELVEVLKANHESLARVEPPETREVEIVLGHEKLSSFNAQKKQNLLHFVAEIGRVPISKVSLMKSWAGSVHAVTRVPTHVAYILKTAALNRDKRLLQYGIHAVRLDGEENYIEVETGEIGPLLLPKRRPPYLKWFFWSIIGLAILAGGLIVAMAGSLPVLNSATSTATLTVTASPTNTQTPSATSTPTSTTTQTTTPTPTGTATQTTTPTPTYTPSLISVIPGHSQNNPQSAPGVLAPPDLKKPLEVIAVPVYPSIPKDPTEPPVCKLVTEVVCDPQTNECKKVEYCK